MKTQRLTTRFARTGLGVLATLFSLIALLFALNSAQTASAAIHAANLDHLVQSAPKGGMVPVIFYLDSRLTMDEVYPVARNLPMSERRQYVVGVLKERFAEMSGDVMERLEVARKEGKVSLLRPLWVLNAIRAHVTPDVIDDIDKSNREVVYITGDPVHPNTLDAIGWGVAEIQAPRVWSELGIRGANVIVGHKDSGTDLDHPGFDGRFWVNPGEDLNGNGHVDGGEENGVDDDGNGYIDDFYGWNFDDDNNDVTDHDAGHHGTKTGSVITSDFVIQGCDTVCVAPDAKLMELAGYLSQGAVYESSQYAIEMGAQVISASLSFKETDCDQYQDCPNYVAHRFVSEMELAAGIVHANSSGNNPNQSAVPLNMPAPASCPPPMLIGQAQEGGVSSIVAVNAYNSSGFFYSGAYGPSAWSHEDICFHPLMPFCGPPNQGNSYPPQFEDYPYWNGTMPGLFKPDVIAPSPVISLGFGGGCNSINGTSGATPHVGGVLALIYSAFPGISPENAYRLLVTTAVEGPGPDSLFGFGKIRPFPACSTGIADLTLVMGRCTEDGEGVTDVRITSNVTEPVHTTASGDYVLWLPSGTHTVHYKKYPYSDVFREIIADGGTMTEDVELARAQAAFLTGTVTGNGQLLENMPVMFPEIPASVTTDASGQFALDMAAGTFEVILGDLPWNADTVTIEIQAGDNTIPFALTRSLRAWPTGPDQFGHFLYDNFDADAVSYEWIEINPNDGGLPGSLLSVGNDNTVVRTLPFTFPYYGQDYSAITVSANGFIILGSTSSDEWHALFIPCNHAPNGFLAPFFDDWEPATSGGVYFYTSDDENYVVVEWFDVNHYYGQGPARFEAILYNPAFLSGYNSEGVAKYQYHTMDGAFEGTVGFENMTGTDGLQYRYQLQYDTHASPIMPGRAVMEIADSTLGATEVAHTALPQKFELYQNYPNPFNPTTIFRWSMPHASRIRLALYDVLGREAAVVFDGLAEAGVHERAFSAVNLPTGIYFARLESEGRSLDVRKIMLLK